MKVLSVPHVANLGSGESGIHTVVRSYFRLAKDYGIDFVTPDADSFDVLAIHAGMSGLYPKGGNIVAHTHGLYWTADYDFGRWAFDANRTVIDSIRHAKITTVPSSWVAETFKRDMRMSPEIVPHGIVMDDWICDSDKGDYVIGYAKNRAGVDVCNPAFLPGFARRFPNIKFIATFAPENSPDNITVTGVMPHEDMKELVQDSRVFISTTKETWGIAMLEAMASGVPVLSFAEGGAIDLVQHGVSGYLARVNDYDDLANGLAYCLEHYKVLGANAREIASSFSWDSAMIKLRDVYELAMRPSPATVSVIIPVYNKSVEELGRAIKSVNEQTRAVDEIIVVDDGSTNGVDYEAVVRELGAEYIRQENGGVSAARNRGVDAATGKYILCLDADDAIAPEFMGVCIPELENDNSLGIAYTGLWSVRPDGSEGLSGWPGDFDYDKQVSVKGFNQIPTACVFRKQAFERVGGYHNRYAPKGAGEEDANLWLRIPSIGFNARKVSDDGLFIYSEQSGYVSGNNHHTPTDWRYMLPWTRDGIHPFASVATPKILSHPVHQYDEPAVSVVVPVGPGHEGYITDALDSIESQTFRKWEAIVVWDSPDTAQLGKLSVAYPYARVITTDGGRGAGFARNRGVEIVRAPFILYLDADDTLHPDCIRKMLDEYGATGSAVYTDYVGKAIVKNVSELAPDLQQNIISYDEKTNVAIIAHKLPDFDCDLALVQPSPTPYIWNNVTTLFPTVWHNEIGGFDEDMDSWEDIDYWWRMAWSGKCFKRVPETLMSYRFTTGSRREVGKNNWDNLMEYLRNKRREML